MQALQINIPITIITEGTEKVKTFQSTINGTPKKVSKWQSKKIQSLRVAEKLNAIGEYRRSERMKQCGDILDYTYCPDCGQYHIKKANLCRDRFCPVCSWRLSLQRYGQMKNLMYNIMTAYPEITDWSLVTLTVKNCYLDDLHDTMQKMSRAWNLAITQRKVRPNLFGWARSVEITFNEDTRQFHPHYHIIIGWWSEMSQKLINKWLSACNKYGLIVSIKAQNAEQITSITQHNGQTIENTEINEDFTKAVLETFKYSVKGSDIDKLNVAEFRTVLKQYGNKRLIAYGGKIKEYARLQETEMETVQDEDNDIRICRNCGNIDIERIIYKWSFGTNTYEILK